MSINEEIKQIINDKTFLTEIVLLLIVGLIIKIIFVLKIFDYKTIIALTTITIISGLIIYNILKEKK